MKALPDLPIRNHLDALAAALVRRPNAILVAPPGTGKTTLVPLALLDAPWRGDCRIAVLEPRRLAARAAATRMAALLGERVGITVGYRTRLDSAVSAATRIEVVTEGLLVRRMQSDPGLDGVAAVIFDEVHERSLDADLALAFCLDLQRGLRPELRLLAMSATPDLSRLPVLMQAETIIAGGRMHAVTIRHAGRDLGSARDLPAAMARAIREALASGDGDILAFLPGMGEIRRTEAELSSCGALVLPLHGELPAGEQDRALRPAEGRRVVLATSIAETSLTVPGVRIVVDGGFRRAPVLDAGSGLARLDTMRISRAAADQRAGRAGREAPGIAIRLWTAARHRGLPAHETPEIMQAELSGLVLDCAAWGAAPGDLPFIDPPPEGARAAAAALLGGLGALEPAGRITAAGRAMARLGAHPRLAAMMLAARDPGEAALAAELAALLEERDPLRAPDAPADIALRLGSDLPDGDRAAASRIRRGAAHYRARLRLPRDAAAAGDPARLIAAGFPDRIAQRRGEPGSFRLAGGGGARLSIADPLARAPLLAVAALELKASARIRLAAPLDPAALPDAVAARITETVESGFDPVSGAVLTRRRRRLDALVLEDRTVPANPASTAAATAAALADALATRMEALPWTDGARQLQARAALMRGIEPDAWPDLSDTTLATSVQDWLAPNLQGAARLSDANKLDLVAILRGMLGWEAAARLDRELPTALALPGGRATIDYTQPVPVAAARTQAFFGLAATPALAGGRIPLRLALLSPAGRPVAVTADLARFWQGGWAEVRRDMRGRYPKHSWPENPLSATAGSG